jgi:hypothetical protein
MATENTSIEGTIKAVHLLFKSIGGGRKAI